MLVHNKEENLNVDDIISKVDGQQIPVDQVSELMDAAKIKKVCLLFDSTDVEQFKMDLVYWKYMYVFHYSSTKSHRRRKSAAAFWTLLFAGWPLKMLHREYIGVDL